MRKVLGSVSIATLLTVVGGTAVAIAWVVQYVNMAVSPIATAEQKNETAIATITANSVNTNNKVNALYDYFLNRGLSEQDVQALASSSKGQ